eukprot:Opistho-1_new@41818
MAAPLVAFAALFAVAVASSLPAFVSAAPHYETVVYDAENVNKLILLACSLLGDVFVLYFHWSTPPHKKFLLLPKRRFFIRLHLISGSLEIVAGIACFLANDPRVPAYIMAAACLAGHSPSALGKCGAVSGMRRSVIPAPAGVLSSVRVQPVQ